MHIWTFKFDKKTAVIILVALALVLALIAIALGASDQGEGCVGSSSDRVAYLESQGWHVSPDPVEEKTVLIPKEFSDVYDAYNQLQRSQGFDLSAYCGQEVTVYTYALTQYDGYYGEVVADLYVCNGKVVAGDIHTLALDGFMHGIVTRRAS